MLYSIDEPIILLIQLAETHKLTGVEIMLPYSLINIGFLRYNSEVIKEILKGKLTIY